MMDALSQFVSAAIAVTWLFLRQVKMRIALVINSLAIGGAERVLTTLASTWAAAAHHVTIFTFETAEASSIFPLHPAVKVVRLDCVISRAKPFHAIAAIPMLLFRLRASVSAFKPDRVISFLDQTNLLTITALIGSGFKVHVSERADPKFSSLMTLKVPGIIRSGLSLLRERLYRLASKVMVQTEGARERFSPDIRAKTIVIPNPILAPAETIASYEPQVVIGLGRFVKQKRFDLLISAFQKTLDKFPDWRLIIFGNGPERQNLQKQIDDAGLGESILLPGAVKDPAEAFKYGSVFVLSSDFEGFPGALGEAMAYGMAVIATDCTFGPAEMITDGMDGVLVPVGDAQAIADELVKMMESIGLREVLGKSALRITARFNIDTISKAWLE